MDASVTLAWFFEDERTAFTQKLLDEVAERGARVPSIWALEVSNALLMGHRRKRITQADLYAGFETLAALPITIDVPSLTHTLAKIPPLAQAHQLTSYDAAYLELALRTGLPLATTDDNLIRAAQQLEHPFADAAGRTS